MAVPNVLTENNKEELATGDLIGHWVGITSGFTGKDPIGIGDMHKQFVCMCGVPFMNLGCYLGLSSVLFESRDKG